MTYRLLEYRTATYCGDGRVMLTRRIKGDLLLDVGCGGADIIRCYRMSGSEYVLVLSMHLGLDYCGLKVFRDGETESMAEIFLQGEEQYREVLGPQGLDLQPTTIVRRLFDAMEAAELT